MKSNPIVPRKKPLLAIGYKHNYRRVLWFIATDGAGSTEPGDTYLSCFPDIYYNVSVWPDVWTHFLVRYLNSCNAIDNNNRRWKSDLAL